MGCTPCPCALSSMPALPAAPGGRKEAWPDGICGAGCHISMCLQTGASPGRFSSWADSPSVPALPPQAYRKCHFLVNSLRLELPQLTRSGPSSFHGSRGWGSHETNVCLCTEDRGRKGAGAAATASPRHFGCRTQGRGEGGREPVWSTSAPALPRAQPAAGLHWATPEDVPHCPLCCGDTPQTNAVRSSVTAQYQSAFPASLLPEAGGPAGRIRSVPLMQCQAATSCQSLFP